MSKPEAEFSLPVMRALDAYAPAPLGSGDWRDVLRRGGGERPVHRRAGSASVATKLSRRRVRLLLLVALVIAVLAGPTYAIGRAVVAGWLGGEPAPQSVVDNFNSYTPQLGFQPEPGKAVRVASDGAFRLYATTNDRGSYCVATSTPDGGICVQPRIAAASLVAGIMPGDPARSDERRTTLIAGRVNAAGAKAITFTDPDGATVTRRIGAGGFFLAAVPADARTPDTVPYPCKNGDWTPTFRAVGATGNKLVTAEITLSQAAASGGVCSWANGPHR